MGLRGSLRDFGISEILQLIGLQHRTGRLMVRTDQGEYQILISSGKIVKVEKKPEAKGEALSEYLIRANFLTASQAQLAEQKAKLELKPLEAVLIGLEMISLLDLKAFIFLRNLDLLHQLFLIKEGEYEFENEPVNYHPNYVVEIDSEQVLMDGYRIKDEWPLIMKEMGSREPIARKKPGEFGIEERLSTEEAKIYNLIDGKRGAMEISALAQLSRFDTLKTIAELKKKGRVELISGIETKPELKKSRAQAVVQSAFWTLMVVLIILLANGFRLYLSKPGLGLKLSSAQSWREERLRRALEIYRLEQGDYPKESLKLFEKDILTKGDLKFVQNCPYYYQEGGYKLLSPKPRASGK